MNGKRRVKSETMLSDGLWMHKLQVFEGQRFAALPHKRRAAFPGRIVFISRSITSRDSGGYPAGWKARSPFLPHTRRLPGSLLGFGEREKTTCIHAGALLLIHRE